MRTSRLVTATVLVPVGAIALLLAGCTSALEPSSTTPAGSSTTSPPLTASPSSTFDIPAEPVEGEVASAVAERRATPPSASSVAGPGTLVAGLPFAVEGECIGTSADFTVTTADPADAGRVLVEGTIDCAEPRKDGFTYTVDYAGPVQLSFTDTEGIERGWLRVVQP